MCLWERKRVTHTHRVRFVYTDSDVLYRLTTLSRGSRRQGSCGRKATDVHNGLATLLSVGQLLLEGQQELARVAGRR